MSYPSAKPRGAAGQRIAYVVRDGATTFTVEVDAGLATGADLVRACLGGASNDVIALGQGTSLVPLTCTLQLPWARPDEPLDLIRRGRRGGHRPGHRGGPDATKATAVKGRLDADLELMVIDGHEAGTRVPLSPGEHRIGRDVSRNDVVLSSSSVSAVHAVLAVLATQAPGVASIRDLGATNGVIVDGATVVANGTAQVRLGAVLQLGAVRVRLDRRARESSGVGPPGDDGARPFYRSPVFPAPPKTAGITIPAVPQVPDGKPRFSWTALVVPLVMGLMMAVLFNPLMAVFAFLGPVMALGTYVEDRRRLTKAKRRALATRADALASVTLQVGAHRLEALSRLEHNHPDAATVLELSAGPGPRLWERRFAGPSNPLIVRVGVATLPWTPPTDGVSVIASLQAAGGLFDVVLGATSLENGPVTVEFVPGTGAGIVGTVASSRSMARSIVCQLANLVGPSELRFAAVVNVTDPRDADDWTWLAMLPHAQGNDDAASLTTGGGAAQLLEQLERDVRRSATATTAATTVLARGFGAPDGSGNPRSACVVVVEESALDDPSRSALRRLVDASNRGCGVVVIVLASAADRLPSFCADTITIVDDRLGLGRVTQSRTNRELRDVVLALAPVVAARDSALALAGLRDPESVDGAAALPSAVSLGPLLGLERPLHVDSIKERWRRGSESVAQQLRAVIGAGVGGPLAVDFVTDGPHALMGGTTGSGKSELLRTLVASLALSYAPTDLNFVLIDYKGGSAFDVCAQLPHVVGLVTDLDEQLGVRALVSLEAELRRRELQLRDHGASDVRAYLESPFRSERPELPRLMVIVDEFATMAKELPDFLNSLVGIAQRGRSLGVHMLLATQRPSGAVNDNIRANTNLRVALRVQDAADSQDVLGVPLAAHISRRLPGRGYARFGPGEHLGFQCARIPSRSEGERRSTSTLPVVVTTPHDARTPTGTSGLTLDDIVDTTSTAWSDLGRPDPFRPWKAALPEALPATALAATALAPADTHAHNTSETLGFALGLCDEPTEQRQFVWSWTPTSGNVGLFGISGSGSSATLLTLASQAAIAHSADDVHLYGIDFGQGVLGPIAALPHTGALVHPPERERLTRLLKSLAAELANRRVAADDTTASSRTNPWIIVLIDNLAGLLATLDEVGIGLRDELARLIADGPALRVVFWIAADRPGAFPLAILAAIPNRLVFRLSDPTDVVQLGLDRKSAPPAIRGRCVAMPAGLAVQIATAGDIGAIADGRSPPSMSPPFPVRSLPTLVHVREIESAAAISDGQWFLPFGLADDTLEATGWTLRPGEHALVTGPTHSGKSTVLMTLGAVAASAGAEVLAMATGRSPLRTATFLKAVCTESSAVETFVQESLGKLHVPTLLLIDDAETVDDEGGAIGRVAANRSEFLHVVVAARADILRSRFGHWTVEIRRSRNGLVLRPVVDLDGDLWFTNLPRRGPARFRDGLGYLVSSGVCQLVQAAQPDE